MQQGGGQQVGIGPEAPGNCGPAAGLLVFLVGAALLALVGLFAETGVVETQTVVAAALGCPRGGRAAAARLVAAGRLAVVRGGGSAGVPESRVLSRAGRGGGRSGLLGGLGHPQCIATLDHLLRGVKRPRVDQSADVARQFAQVEGDLRLFKRCRLQGSQVVPQNRGPGVAAAHGIIKPLAGPLLVTEAAGSQEELLQLLVQVCNGSGIPRQRADGGDQREGHLRHAQWNFVIDWVMFAVAKVESRQLNQHCRESA